MTQNFVPLPPHDFYLVRHGESEANIRRVAAGGEMDSPLTEAGIQQAKTLAAAIHHLPIKPSRIYHSSQSRARHTAGYINEFLDLEMIEIHDLREHMFGDWGNVSWDIIRALAEKNENPPNGETYDQFAHRISSAINGIFETTHDAPPMFVAHGGVFKSIARLYHLRIETVGNCALYHYQHTPSNASFPWTVTSYTASENDSLQQLKIA